MATERSRAERVRRTAARRGFSVSKVRRIDPQATDYGLWSLDDPRFGLQRSGLTLEDLERYIDTGELPPEE